MASDIVVTMDFWTRCFGAKLVADETMAGTRNVFLDIGGGRLNLYEQPPNQRGPVNHLGVHVRDLPATVSLLNEAGWEPRPIKTDGPLSYSMVEGPDGLLIEVFHFDADTTPDHLRPYFDLTVRRDDHKTAGASDGRGVAAGAGIGDGALSEQALTRLQADGPPRLRPPPLDDLGAVDAWRRSIHAQWLDGDPDAAECGHQEVTVAGVRCLRAGPAMELDGDGEPLVIYFHGGGYALGSPEVALPITERLARHVELLSVDYRLAPEHPYPAAIDDGFAVYRELALQIARPVVLAGDSAGANVAVSLAARARAAGLPEPVALVLLSPHLGFGGAPSSTPADPMTDLDDVGTAWLRDAYRGDLPLDDPGLSPVDGNLDGLPPTLVQVGSSDSSFADGVRFVRRSTAAGRDASLDVWHGLWHTWHYHRELPEADNAINDAARFIADVVSRR